MRHCCNSAHLLKPVPVLSNKTNQLGVNLNNLTELSSWLHRDRAEIRFVSIKFSTPCHSLFCFHGQTRALTHNVIAMLLSFNSKRLQLRDSGQILCDTSYHTSYKNTGIILNYCGRLCEVNQWCANAIVLSSEIIGLWLNTCWLESFRLLKTRRDTHNLHTYTHCTRCRALALVVQCRPRGSAGWPPSTETLCCHTLCIHNSSPSANYTQE